MFSPSSDSLPLVRTIDLLDPLAVLAPLSAMPYPFLLHSSLLDDRSRWTFFGADPFEVFRDGDAGQMRRAFEQHSQRTRGDEATPSAVPFTGGAVGYWSYDYGRRLERLPVRAVDDLRLPDFLVGFYDVIGAFDHLRRQCWLFSSGLPLEGRERFAHAEDRLDRFTWQLAGARRELLPSRMLGHMATAHSNFRPDDYMRAIERVQDHIARGDLYQANLSQRWTLDLGAGRPGSIGAALFDTLANVSAAPFAAYLDAGNHAVVSASPERFLELRGRRVETRPIKGTRPRGGDAAEDERLAAELLSSAKDRAENVMIVDVLRNDLGRVCEPGTVVTSRLCELERFPQVHHLTSTIAGRLRDGVGAFDLLDACFPGGSITGAPKIRAMEILEGLEPVRRHLYTGSIGYVDWNGDADWNIAIRTALVTESGLHFAAGGGITSDSDPEAEYHETLHKAEGMRLAVSDVLGPVRLEPPVVAA